MVTGWRLSLTGNTVAHSFSSRICRVPAHTEAQGLTLLTPMKGHKGRPALLSQEAPSICRTCRCTAGPFNSTFAATLGVVSKADGWILFCAAGLFSSWLCTVRAGPVILLQYCSHCPAQHRSSPIATCCIILHCSAFPPARRQAVLQQALCLDALLERISRGHMEPSEAPDRASDSCSCACWRRARATVAA